MNKLKRYFWNILITIDQFCNTLLGGDPDETMSSRFGKWLSLPHNTIRWRIAYPICVLLHLFQSHHCIRSIEEDEGANDIIGEKGKK